MKIYLSGPMTGLPNFNYDAFWAAAADLRDRGYTVDNPADHYNSFQGLPHTKYMRKDIKGVLAADAVVVLPGWQQSKGALIEVACGAAIGLPILEYPVLANLNIVLGVGSAHLGLRQGILEVTPCS